MPPDSYALSLLPAGQQAVVCALMGGREFGSRAANLGFTVGAQVKAVQNYGRGPMIVSVRGTLVAMGRGEADKVYVRGERRSKGSPV